MIYLPDFAAEWALSRWTGRPHGLTIDPIGVEAFVVPEAPKGVLARFRKHPTEPTAYLHVLVHSDITSDRIRSWAARQVAVLTVLEQFPDAVGDELNRLTDEAAAQLADREWTPASVTVDGAPVAGSAYVATPTRWAAYVELGDDRIALVGRDLTLDEARLRTASTDEARQIRTDALRV